MIFGRVLFGLTLRFSENLGFHSLNVFKELLFRKQFSVFTYCCGNVTALDSTANRFTLQIRAQTGLYLSGVHSMNPATIYGGANTEVDLDEDEEEEDRRESRDGPEPGATLKPKITADQVEAVSMDVIEASKLSVPPASSKKPSKSQKRREKKKLTRKKFKPPDISADLMSELPFALTSPTTWKELGFPIPESTEKKRKRKRGERVDSEEDGDSKKKKREIKRPNYFLSIPITNTQITSAVAEVQESVLQQEPRLAKAMIPVPTLHITLLVTHLANQEQVDLAAAVLGQAEPAVAELLGGRDLVLPFSGIRHFRKEVVFVGLADGEHRRTLDRLAELLRSRFEEQDLLQGDGRDFEPHLTIMKLSRASKLRSQGVKRVDPSVYADYTNKFFGSLTVERVDLCSMLKKKQQDGYYHTETSLQLGGRRRSEPDEAELLRVSKRLVEDAVNRALQQYKQETLQNGGGPNAAATKPPGNTEETSGKTDTIANSTDNRK
ncbi:A-kinase anchor protein 7 isoform gamma [Oryzias melastigma]|uniref:A-kinase anchor protein 7 isoform gamma n=1 Tax=Oryzias melastigma TaxID=30732 RepID=A0A3B3CIS5_ORYME|nr:A-kinase anchor protein 7 isoform gamma [Oryzias melastigma]